jgi:hypothetical protein
MSAGVPTVNVSEAQGYSASSTAIDKYAVVVGCTSTGSGASSFFQTGQALRAARGYGDAVDTCGQMIEQRQNSGQAPKIPVAIYSVDIGTPASYGAIDDSGVQGTATIDFDATSLPLGTYEPRIKIVTGGTVGTTGITFKWSLDGGRTESRTISLGTATSYTIPNSGVKFEFSPASADLTALNTLINEIFTDFNAHVILVAGTVHTNADTGNVVSAGTYPSATNTATRIARVNALRAAALLHYPKGSGGVPATHINVSGDAASVTTLTAVPVATDDDSALALALALKSTLNLHDANTTAHTIADATNTVSAASPSAGTLLADDIAFGRTFGPAPIAADLYDGSTSPPTGALYDLAISSLPFSILVLEFPLTASLAVAVTSGLNAMASRGKVVKCTARTRIRDFEAGETEQEWSDAVALDFLNYDDSRIMPHAGYGLVTDALTGRRYLRSTMAQVAADEIAGTISTWTGSPNASPSGMSNVSLADDSGADVGHDEGPRGTGTGLANFDLGNRFSCLFRDVDERVWTTVPSVLYGEAERIRNGPARRTVNAIKRVARAAAFTSLGGKIHYERADASVPGSLPTLPESTRLGLQATIFAALAIFADDIDNADDGAIETGLVQVSKTVTVTNGNLVSLTITVAPELGGLVVEENIIIAVQE